MDLSIVYLKKRKAFGRAATHLIITEPEPLGEFETNEALIASYPERTRVLLNVQAVPERSEHWVGACRPVARARLWHELAERRLSQSPHKTAWPSCVTAQPPPHLSTPLATDSLRRGFCTLHRPRARGIPEPRHEPHGGRLAQGRRSHREGPDRTLPQEGYTPLITLLSTP